MCLKNKCDFFRTIGVLFFIWCCITFFSACKAKAKTSYPLGKDLPELQAKQKNHTWYAFTENSIMQVDLPQKAPEVFEKPWTEAIRVSSCASSPSTAGSLYACALVNRLGLLVLEPSSIKLYQEASIFNGVTVDSIVYSSGTPVFYMYRSSFFNKSLEKGENESLLPSRPFLVEFNASSNTFYPLVTYSNLNLKEDEQIIGFFWDGKVWTCTSKRILNDRVEFSYFYWEPNIPITELSPALSSADLFTFRPSTEDEYRYLNMPRSFKNAPEELKTLIASIPPEMTLSISWRDTSGTSPIQYYQQGNGNILLYAHGTVVPRSNYAVVVFADGTTYLKQLNNEEESGIVAFRLPLLPAGYSYGEVALAGNTLYVSWEQSSFYKTGRAGLISVDLAAVLSQVN